VFTGIRTLFRLRGGRARSFEAHDRDLALYGPISLFSLAATWLILTGIGYTRLFWSLGDRPLRQALVLSGSSIYTLGFEVPPNMPTTLLAFSEAGVGLVLLAMLISYLLSMYQSFQRREAAEAGVPLKADLEQAWRDFAGWRGQLRPGAAGTGRADHGPARAVVLGSVDDRAERAAQPPAQPLRDVSRPGAV
jgi:hypothetical protein